TIEVDDILVAHPDAAGGDVGADGPGLVGSVDAIERGAEIHRARPERILRPAFHVAGQIGTACDHLRRWRPVRPFALGGDGLDARPGEAGTTDTDAIAQRAAAAFDQEQEFVGRVDHDRAGAFAAVIIDLLLFEFRIERLLPRIVGLLTLFRAALLLRHRLSPVIGGLLLIHRLSL